MRKVWLILMAGLVVLMFYGCEEEPTGPIEPPEGLSVAVDPTDATHLGLIVSWMPSPSEDSEDGIDGYYIYFNGELIDSTKPGECNYSFRPDGLGTISVTAYRGDEESEEVSFNTRTVDSREEISLGGWYTDKESGIAWDEAGEYSLYSAVSGNAAHIDVVWYGDTAENAYMLLSPSVVSTENVSWDTIPGVRTTVFAPDDGNGYPPDSGYTAIDVVEHSSYYVKIQSGYYLLLTVNSIDDEGNARISYKFQKIQGYKRVY